MTIPDFFGDSLFFLYIKKHFRQFIPHPNFTHKEFPNHKRHHKTLYFSKKQHIQTINI
jgi:hypothetical protein